MSMSVLGRKVVFAVFMGAAIFALPGQEALAKINGSSGLSPRLVSTLNRISKHFGRPVKVVSGCRSHTHNRRIGGAKESYHLRCQAADIHVVDVSRGKLLAYARTMPGRGGVGGYCRQSFVHVDVGPNRDWDWGCGKRKSKFASKRVKKSFALQVVSSHKKTKRKHRRR